MPDWSYQPAFKPLLFRLPPDEARRTTLRLLEIQSRTAAGSRLFEFMGHAHPPESVAVHAFGLRFPSPVGLGPGIDIAGVSLAAMQHLGFGFLTVGPVGEQTVARTASTDPLRLENEHCLAMSLEAGGPDAASLAAHIAALPELHVPVGMALRGRNLGAILQVTAPAIHYYTLPTSCANDLSLLPELRASTTKPLLLRLSPDWSRSHLDRVLEAAMEAGLDGFVAVSGAACGLLPEGELDGPFLRDLAVETVAHVVNRCGSGFPVIGAGGIMTPADAAAFLQAGACMVELYAGLVYAGPGLPKRVYNYWLKQPRPVHDSLAPDVAVASLSGNGVSAVEGAPATPTRIGIAVPDDPPSKQVHSVRTTLDAPGGVGWIQQDTNAAPQNRMNRQQHFVLSRDAWLFVALTGLVLILSGIAALI
nr:hypothetical protein [Armatimonadota bacterium]